MIKTYLKHQVIDRLINVLFDGFIKTFASESVYKVGEHYNSIVVEFMWYGVLFRRYYYNVDIKRISNGCLYVKYEYDITYRIYDTESDAITAYNYFIDRNRITPPDNILLNGNTIRIEHNKEYMDAINPLCDNEIDIEKITMTT